MRPNRFEDKVGEGELTNLSSGQVGVNRLQFNILCLGNKKIIGCRGALIRLLLYCCSLKKAFKLNFSKNLGFDVSTEKQQHLRELFKNSSVVSFFATGWSIILNFWSLLH